MATCNCPFRKYAYCDHPKCLDRAHGKKPSRGCDWSKVIKGWRIIGGLRIYFRSLWEINFARVLQWHLETGTPFRDKIITKWEYEPQTFIFHAIQSGTRSYKPDFKVYFEAENLFGDNAYEWFEVKGHMKQKDKTKIRRFRKYYPSETLHIIGADWFKANRVWYRSLVPDWEDAPTREFA